jgi:hypothetical protein
VDVKTDYIQQFNSKEDGFVYLPQLLVDGVPTGIEGVEAAPTIPEAESIADSYAERLRDGITNGTITDNRAEKNKDKKE